MERFRNQGLEHVQILIRLTNSYDLHLNSFIIFIINLNYPYIVCIFLLTNLIIFIKY